MRRASLILAALALPLGGCAASLAASAVGMAMRSAQGTPQSNSHLKPAAVQACSERAAGYGAVHVIDVEQRTAGRMVVWGTATGAAGRQSFECHFTNAIAAFKLRPIRSGG